MESQVQRAQLLASLYRKQMEVSLSLHPLQQLPAWLWPLPFRLLLWEWVLVLPDSQR